MKQISLAEVHASYTIKPLRTRKQVFLEEMNKADAQLAIFTWIESWYNPLRRHSSLGQRSPNVFERSLKHQQNKADIIENLDPVREVQSVR